MGRRIFSTYNRSMRIRKLRWTISPMLEIQYRLWRITIPPTVRSERRFFIWWDGLEAGEESYCVREPVGRSYAQRSFYWMQGSPKGKKEKKDFEWVLGGQVSELGSLRTQLMSLLLLFSPCAHSSTLKLRLQEKRIFLWEIDPFQWWVGSQPGTVGSVNRRVPDSNASNNVGVSRP